MTSPIRAFHHHRDHRSGARPVPGQPPRQPPRRRIQPRVRHARVPARHRHRIRRPGRLRREQPRRRRRRDLPRRCHSTPTATGTVRPRPGSPPRPPGPSGSAATASSTRTSRRAICPASRRPNRSAADRHRAEQPARTPLPVKNLRPGRHPGPPRHRRAAPGTGPGSMPGSSRTAAAALFCTASTTWIQRVAGRGPGRGQDLDQPLERHVLVGQRAQPGLPDPAEQHRERRVPRHIRAQHQVVDEEPDQVIEGLIGHAPRSATRPGYPPPRPAGTAAPPARRARP